MAQVPYISSFNILVLSQDPNLCKELQGYLKPFGYQVTLEEDGMKGLERVRRDRPDMVLADMKLPPLSGFDLCRSIKQAPTMRNTPVILVGDSYSDVESKVQALSVGADDTIYKPVHGGELRARVRSALRLRAYVQQISEERSRLEELVSKRTREIHEITLGVVSALETAASLNDEDTGGHIKRVCAYSAILARELGMNAGEVESLRLYASMHDVGKVGLPDSILKKRGKLTSEEFETMKQHTTLGHSILKAAKTPEQACNIALYHHECYDGSGYPSGVARDAIPIEARIVTLADVYDALTSDRCYRIALGAMEASRIIVEASGTQFDPTIVQVFMKHHNSFLEVRERYGD